MLVVRSRLLGSVFLKPSYARPGEEGAGAPEGDDAPSAAGEETLPEGDDAPPAAGEETSPEGNEPPPEASATEKKDWRDRQIARQHRQLQEERRQKDELASSLQAAQEMLNRLAGDGEPPAGGSRPAPSQSDAGQPTTQEEIEAAANRVVAEREFKTSANNAFAAGAERYKEKWPEVLDTLKTLGGFNEEEMKQILSVDDPAKVLYEFGTNPDKYQEIMDLPAAKRFTEIVKLGMAATKVPKRPSGAPPPEARVTGHNQGDPLALSDELDDDEWYRRRKAQKDQRYRERQGARA